ncbi:MAG: hypothetical protein AB8B58_02645 [Roseobacter sp.]
MAVCLNEDWSNEGVRSLYAQELTVVGHQVLALQISYAGEVGRELHIPDQACLDACNAGQCGG